MHRGLHLIAHKENSIKAPLANAPIPHVLKLSMRAKGHLRALVASGDLVLLGQPLARSDSQQFNASVSGRIIAIDTENHALTVTIENDGRDARHPDNRPITDYLQLEPKALQQYIANAGIVGLGGAAFPTSTKLQAAFEQNTKILVINGVECEPFITCDDALMRTEPDDVVFGTQALLHASGATEAVIAIEADKPDSILAISQALEASKESRIRIQAIAVLYPAGGERQLIQTLTSREVPSSGVPADIGVLCQNVGTAASVARLINTGEPLISRVVTITGNGVKQAQNLRVRFGTPIASLIEYCGGYTNDMACLIMGGTMMGTALSDDSLGVSAATNCIAVATPQDIAPRRQEMPCIRCGDCAEVCPAGLLPQQLLRYARTNDRNALQELGLHDCIECGCCDYVCPSQIRLTSTFDLAKRNA